MQPSESNNPSVRVLQAMVDEGIRQLDALARSPAADAERECRLGGKTPWEFACDWYSPDEVSRSIFRQKRGGPVTYPVVPEDIYSEEFAAWMTEQYRLAMAKGIDIGLRTVTPAARGEG